MDDVWGARRVSAGPFEASLDGCALRDLRVGGAPLLTAVAVTTRGLGWTTPPAGVERVVVDEDGDGFRVSFSLRQQDAHADVRFAGTIEARADGTLRWHARGRAERDQTVLRAGWSVLLDRRLAGSPYRAITPDGPLRARLPLTVLAQAWPEDGDDDYSRMPALTQLTLALPGGPAATLAVTGAVFELEDQRNWHDASFKLYCPPLVDGPLRLTAGHTWEQGLTLRVGAVDPAPRRRPARARARARVALGAPTGHRLPVLGAMAGRPAHPSLRHVAIRAGDRPAPDVHPLELLVEPGDTAAVDRVLETGRVVRILATGAGGAPPATSLLRALRAATAGAAPVFARADAFVGLNARPPEPREADGLAWGAHPQAHATDERSIAETVATQADVVATARLLAGSSPLAVSPLRLAPPGTRDPRADAPFASAWLLGMLAALGCAGVATVTLDDVVDGAVLDDLAAVSGDELVACTAPPEVAALVARDRHGTARALLANLSPTPLEVEVAGIVIPLASGARADALVPADAIAPDPLA